MTAVARNRLLVLLALLGAGAVRAATDIAVIEVRNRTAEDLIGIVRMVLEPSDAVAAQGSKLIIRADPSRIAEVRSLLDQLDRPAHRLLITVSHDSRVLEQGYAVGAVVRGGVGPYGTDLRVRGGLAAGQQNDRVSGQQRVQTLDGQTAMIQAGNQVPLPYGYGGIQYQNVTTGFAVTPRLSGDRVILDLAPWSDQMSRSYPGAIATQSANTRLTAALGQWIEVGGVGVQASREQSGILERGALSASGDTRFYLKVDDLDAGQP